MSSARFPKAVASLWNAQLETARPFSTSSGRNDDSKPSFPGGFASGAGKFGSFGAFASKAKPTATSGLLPHELAARKTAAIDTPKPAIPTSTTEQARPWQPRQSKPPRKPRPADPTRDEKTLKSKSVLADIFRSDRQPQNPARPASWSSNDRKAHGDDAARKSGDSNIWEELTKKKRDPVPHAKGVQRARTPNKSSKQGRDESWGEVEGQEGASEMQKSRYARERQVPKKMQGKYAGVHSHPSHVGDDLVPNELPTDPSPTKQRKSRFDEALPARDGKKTKKAKRQGSGRMNADEDLDDDAGRWEAIQERKRAKEARKAIKAETLKVQPIFLPEYISATDLAHALKQHVDSFMSDMEEMGFENITGDTVMTGETAALVAMEYGFEPTVDNGSKRDLQPGPIPEDVSSLPSRPPVVTIMGHVDHGKTTLLDYLRKSSVAAQEHGGITQHIGAFVVSMSTGKQITFLDTPGHAAFLSMRQRGANVTDIVVLVVAADDSVKPQTLEALKHARAAKVPIIVAINKIDKEDARIDQVKADLSRHGVEIEDYGGDVQVVCVSGKTGQGMNELEENIITLSEILDVRAEPDGMADGWLLESSVKQNGKAATVLVKRGTLRPGDHVVAGKTWARIRLLRNEAGAEIKEAPPGTPVEILGWRELPAAGEMVLQAPDEAKAKMAVEYRLEMANREANSVNIAEQEQRQREKVAADTLAVERAELGEEAEDEAAAAAPSVLTQSFIVKADVAGSVEAVVGSILEQGNHEVRSKVLRSSAGQVTEYDVDLAAASGSFIVNFNTPVPPHIKQRADEAKVRILDHTVIYHVIDDVRAALGDLLPALTTQRVQGEADILQVFPINVTRRVIRNIAGCRVRNGTLKKGTKVKVLRKGQVVYDGVIDTIKHGKKDVQEMGKGTECGIGLEDFEEFQEDDQLQTYEVLSEKRSL
ncbi:mitochondrial translation initiation factor [Akanthomyces lecanii RCEF 1005]|uniref:Translation initiation factor IF-2, mitochondrial n=1 Tax=Akanthomyces lecanii RCEF 1005 TaxID=1081108 RepID=A0A168KKX6_CORDF|nr:mitochondrial translation initiation factor [Akanthomyces lecanii RCEF 1005]